MLRAKNVESESCDAIEKNRGVDLAQMLALSVKSIKSVYLEVLKRAALKSCATASVCCHLVTLHKRLTFFHQLH